MLIDKRSAIAIVVLFSSSNSYGFFDPFTIAAGVSAVSGLMQTSKDLDDIADIGISAGELLGEFDVDFSNEKEVEEQIKRLEDLNRQSRDLQDVSVDANNIFENDLVQSQALAKKIRSVRDMVKLSKRVTELMGLRPKAGERALKVQETKLNYLILDELMSIRKMQFESLLESREQKARLSIAMGKVLREEGLKSQFSYNRRMGRRL